MLTPPLQASYAVATCQRSLVTIFGFSPDRGFYIEGRAEIVGPTRWPNEFKVRFEGERSIRIRFVMWEWQASPAHMLRQLQRFFATQKRADLFDFFPSE